MVRVVIKWGKAAPMEVDLNPCAPVADFKQALYELTGARAAEGAESCSFDCCNYSVSPVCTTRRARGHPEADDEVSVEGYLEG